MNVFVIYSRHDQSRKWDLAPGGTLHVDWYDRQARADLLAQTGKLHVGRFPTVGIWTPEWTDYTHGEDTVEAGWTLLSEPDTWDDVEAAQTDYADRALRGWAAGVEKPPTGTLTWTDRPEVGEDEQAVPSWEGSAEGGWTLVWTVEPIEEDVDDSDRNGDS